MAYFAKNAVHAWLNYHGTNNTIRDDHNVSSVTDNATGVFTVNFTDAFADANYCAVAIPSRDSTSEFLRHVSYTNGDTYSTGSFKFRCIKDSDTSGFDRPYNFIAFIGSDV